MNRILASAHRLRRPLLVVCALFGMHRNGCDSSGESICLTPDRKSRILPPAQRPRVKRHCRGPMPVDQADVLTERCSLVHSRNSGWPDHENQSRDVLCHAVSVDSVFIDERRFAGPRGIAPASIVAACIRNFGERHATICVGSSRDRFRSVEIRVSDSTCRRKRDPGYSIHWRV